MNDKLLHTPDGVRDIYDKECELMLDLKSSIMSVIRGAGYSPIQTPTFEFSDIFGQKIGTTPQNELYRFFDRDGNTLVLRPDITPSVARACARYYKDFDGELRFCYLHKQSQLSGKA